MVRHVIDRIEESVAHVEGLGDVPRALLPTGAREGDVLRIDAGEGEVRIALDEAARSAAEAETRRLQETLVVLVLSDDEPLEL